MTKGELSGITQLFASGLVTFSLDEYENYPVYKQYALQVIAKETYNFNLKMKGAKIRKNIPSYN